MPPRYAYWTIIVDEQPTAFRAGAKEELMPTFNRLQQKHPSARMMWFQNGKLWPSRIDAQEAMLARGEMGRRGDARQAGSGFRDRERRPARDRVARTAWSPRGEPSTPPPARSADDKLDWKPKGEFVPAPKRADRPDWKAKSSEKPAWKPKGSVDRDRKPEWKPKGEGFARSDPKPRTEWRPKAEGRPKSAWSPKPKTDWKPRASGPPKARPDWKPRGDEGGKPAWKPKGAARSGHGRDEKLDWKPRGEAEGAKPHAPSPRSSAFAKASADKPEKRKWVPKEEYKKSLGIEAKRDKNWRPGGVHKDPRQKYKDAKKAKWSRFKKTIRTRSSKKKS